MPLERLREYRTDTSEPAGLDAWWTERLELARAQAQPATFMPYEPDVYRPFRVFDVEFSGAGGDPVRAWYIRPAAEPGSIVVKFIGYGGGRGAPADARASSASSAGVSGTAGCSARVVEPLRQAWISTPSLPGSPET